MLIEHIKVARLLSENTQDFYRVIENDESSAWCYCCAWWVNTRRNWGEQSADENQALRKSVFDRGIYDGYLLYLNDEPSGWCQVWQRDELPALVEYYHFAPDATIWAITCFVLLSPNRGQGLAHHFLAGILADLKSRGVHTVQAFPRTERGLPADEVWTGPEALYRKAGFTRVIDHPVRSVWKFELQAELNNDKT